MVSVSRRQVWINYIKLQLITVRQDYHNCNSVRAKAVVIVIVLVLIEDGDSVCNCNWPFL